MIFGILKKIFGTKSQRDLKRMLPLVNRINEIEQSYQQLSDDELKAKTVEFKQRLKDGETTEDILCEAFAAVKNACRRLMGQEIEVCNQSMKWDMIPYDVQLLGAIALHRGNIAEMATGEGKTLVATMPLYLNALTGRNCQLVTVNDFLARRDSEWMGVVYKYLGLTVGCLQNMMSPRDRKEHYKCDITYGTNSEFGFDYLRDMGMATEAEQLTQRDHYYVIIDEVDSVLIDEARTPLIISGPAAVSTHQFDKMKPLVGDLVRKQTLLCSRLIKEARAVFDDENASSEAVQDAYIKLLQVKFGMPGHKQLMHILEDGTILKELEKVEARVRSDNNRGLLQEVQSSLYFTMDERGHEADLTELGRQEISPDDPEAFTLPDMLGEIHQIENDEAMSDEKRAEAKQKFQQDFADKSERLQNISQLLRAYCLFEKDVHYVVQQGKVMIVDEHTGRLMPGRRFNEGLHQALEAKENVTIEKETQTLASITIQNYFRMYEKLAGMTGTAETEASEFYQIYKLDVIVVPTNRPCRRIDGNDLIFKTKREKYNAIVSRIAEMHGKGQPVLLGTVSVDDSEILSRMLKRQNIPHNVLNAKNHQKESEIVARAGQPGSVTVATNMAGRGTDIKLGEGVVDLGGLHVIGSARHDSRRIDRQLRGRCSRQGDPGSSQFYVSLEDNLMRLFASDWVVKIMDRFGFEEGEELEHHWLTRAIEGAQRRVEQHHFAIRKRTLEFDDVMNKQREIVYGLRKDVLLSETPLDVLFSIVDRQILEQVENAAIPRAKDSGFDVERLYSWLKSSFPVEFSREELSLTGELTAAKLNDLACMIGDRIEDAYKSFLGNHPDDLRDYLIRHTVLEALDRLWQEHLYGMDHLRSSITLRHYAQKDPLVEYKHEAFSLFETLMANIYQQTIANMFRVTVAGLNEFESLFENLPQELIHQQFEQFADNLPPEALARLESGAIPEDGEEDIPGITFRRDAPKVGRNDRCPCGSGKKYKKCCGK